MRGLPPLRYGIELEGPHKGMHSLVLLSVVYQAPGAIDRALHAKPGPRVALHEVQHVWLERQPWERYAWHNVRALLACMPDARFTLLVMDDADVPPNSLRGKLAMVWRVPEDCVLAAQVCGHLQVLTADAGSFEGFEVTVNRGARAFDRSAYERDTVWTV